MFHVYAHYPVSAEREGAAGEYEFPADTYHKASFKSFKAAKSFCLRLNTELNSKRTGLAKSAVAVIVNGGVELQPNRYGRYEGFE